MQVVNWAAAPNVDMTSIFDGPLVLLVIRLCPLLSKWSVLSVFDYMLIAANLSTCPNEIGCHFIPSLPPVPVGRSGTRRQSRPNGEGSRAAQRSSGSRTAGV